MSGEKRILMQAGDIDIALQRICLQIIEKNKETEKIAIVGIHTCGVHLGRRLQALLSERLGREVPYGSLDINLYRDDWSLMTQNPVVKTTDIGFAVDGARVILVDDVVFSGRTSRAAMEALFDFGRPQCLQLATLIDRGERELPIQPDYVGMETEIQVGERISVLVDENNTCTEVVVERIA